MGKAIKTILILVVLGAIVYFGAQFFAPDESADTGLVSSSDTAAAAGDGENIGGEFVTLLLNMRTIKLDDSFFQSTSFKALEDFSTNIQPENNQGRPNPFAPIGQDGASASASVAPPASGTGAATR